MVCAELVKDAAGNGVVDQNRFKELHSDGRRIITRWAKRALQEDKSAANDPFEHFIFAWIAFNGWATCVTGKDKDIDYLAAIYRDERLNSEFIEKLSGDFLNDLNCFQKLWPIFNAKDVRGIISAHDRAQTIRSYREKVPKAKFRPQCAYSQHNDSNIPLDLSHTLSAIYQVRCNLFHGLKGMHCENDKETVSVALRVMIRILEICIPTLAAVEQKTSYKS